MNIKIEKKKVISHNRKKGSQSCAIFEAMNKMEIDESFVITHSSYYTFSQVRLDSVFYQKYFIHRREGKNIRVFRLR